MELTLASRTLSYSENGTKLNSSKDFSISTAKRIGPISWDDATWILASTFIIFTMQSGFGLLEAGCVSAKNEVNIMVKNAVDVIFGGLTYWLFGYGLSYGEDKYSNPFTGIGRFLVDSRDSSEMGLVFSTYIFQLSFATTATTIVSGAMAERTCLNSYMIFSLLNTIIYCVPAHWLWGSNGFLYTMGCIDIAGSGGVHLVGGTSGLVATMLLGPRLGRYDEGYKPATGNPTNCLVGMFMLWWAWLGFNSGSTFGISGGKWKLAAKSAVITINASMGGGCAGILYSYITRKGKCNVGDLVNSVLGGLVAVTAGCALLHPWEAVIIGLVGGLVAVLSVPFFDWLKIDDPVGAISVHGMAGIWGMLSVGLFVGTDPVEQANRGNTGLFRGSGFYLLGVQAFGCVCIMAWSAGCTFIMLYAIKTLIGLRVSEYEEMMGADFIEHEIPQEFAWSATVTKNSVPTQTGRRRSTFGLVRSDGGSFRRNNSLPSNMSVLTETNGITNKGMIFEESQTELNEISIITS